MKPTTSARRAAILSFRLGGTDGVSIEAAKWRNALHLLGFHVVTVAGEGDADHLLPGLAMSAPEPPPAEALAAALATVDVVVVENLCSLPLNRDAAVALATALAGRAAILHHHDLAWERTVFTGNDPGWPPDDPAWRHVCISDQARDSLLLRRGLDPARVHRIYNTFDPSPRLGDRDGARSVLGVAPHEALLLQPTRAIARKNIPAAVALAEQLGATYWLLGEAEDGYDPTLETVLAGASVRLLRGPDGLDLASAYAACDVVTLLSTWEGFGNPCVEAGLHGRPVVVGEYPVASELAGLGFRWFTTEDVAAIGRYLADPDPAIAAWNGEIARKHFSTADLPERIDAVIGDRS